MTNLNPTAHKILDAAERRTQTKGFNAFSYKDLQEEVGVRTSTMHYYFATKQDLGCAMTERYAGRFYDALAHIDLISENAKTGIEAFFEIFAGVARTGKLCLCGMLTADALALSPSNLDQLGDFFDKTEFWLSSTISQGLREGDFHGISQPAETARMLLATLEGGLFIARTRKNPEYIDTVIHQCRKTLGYTLTA